MFCRLQVEQPSETVLLRNGSREVVLGKNEIYLMGEIAKILAWSILLRFNIIFYNFRFYFKKTIKPDAFSSTQVHFYVVY